jgi:DNA-binding NarL/FixJ family response regulator
MDAIEPVGKARNITTKRREWWGWFGSAVWLFFMMYGFSAILFPDDPFLENISYYPFFFMVVFALSIIAFGFRFGRDPDSLSRIAVYTTPVAFVITAVFALLPPAIGHVLYAISPLFMAPAVTRRVYGVIHTAEPGKTLTRYMSCITVCVIAFTAWLIIDLPKEVAFLVPALLLIPVWLGVRKSVTLPVVSLKNGAYSISKRLAALLAGAIILLLWLDTMNACIHSLIVATSSDNAEAVIFILGLALPPIGFLLYGMISDRGHERAGFVCGIMLFLAGLVITLLPGDAQGPLFIPLAVTEGLGGSYTEFFILTIPIYFYIHSKRPVLFASLGLAINLMHAALLWVAGIWLPEVFRTFGIPLLASAAISAIGFIVLVYFLFERHREKSLAAALYSLLTGDAVTAGAPDVADIPDTTGLISEEREIAVLLIEGYTKGEIARKLHLQPAEVSERMSDIRAKIAGAPRPADELIANAAARYKLTRREAQILRGVYEGKTNATIAEEHFLSEETVKFHSRNLMKKLPVENRAQLRDWLLGGAG